MLRPRPSQVEIGARRVSTCTYDGGLPGPEVRLRQGRPVRIRVDNDLEEPTTIHWHGIRLRENDADGVPGLTQDAIAPGDSYLYEFTPPDAGTFFFHSHAGMQLDRGLYAPLIVEAADETLDYHREAVLVIDDWLDGVNGTPEAQLEALRVSGMAMHGMAGRGPAPAQPFGPVRGRRATSGVFMANLALAGGLDADDVDHPLHLINGRPPEAPFQLDVRRGKRVRLRFINAAADTIYAVFVEGHELRVTHADGLPVEPVATDALLMGMAERFDALIEPRGEGGRLGPALPQRLPPGGRHDASHPGGLSGSHGVAPRRKHHRDRPDHRAQARLCLGGILSTIGHTSISYRPHSANVSAAREHGY